MGEGYSRPRRRSRVPGSGEVADVSGGAAEPGSEADLRDDFAVLGLAHRSEADALEE